MSGQRELKVTIIEPLVQPLVNPKVNVVAEFIQLCYCLGNQCAAPLRT